MMELHKYKVRKCYRIEFISTRHIEYMSDINVEHTIRWVTDTMNPLELFKELDDKYLPQNEVMNKIIKMKLIGDVCVPYSEVWDG